MTPERSKVDSALAECGTSHGQPPSSRHSPCRTGLQARSSSVGIAETGLETRSPFPRSTATPTGGLQPLTSYANGSETLRLKPQLLFHDARTLQSGFGFSRMCACHGQPPSSRHSPRRTGLQARSSSVGVAETGLELRSPFPPSTATPTGATVSPKVFCAISNLCASAGAKRTGAHLRSSESTQIGTDL
jgi:hypothetical protein